MPTDDRLTLAGPLREQIDGVIQHWLLVAPEQNPALLEMLADRNAEPARHLLPWSGEFAGKYLTGATEVLRLTGDPALHTHLRAFVSRLISLQAENGYLGPYSTAYQLTGSAPYESGLTTWDAWNHYHLLLGLLEWYELEGDQEALHCAERIGDLLCTRFSGPGQTVAAIGSPDQNQSVIHGMALLYRATGAPRYLALAERIVEEFALPGAGDYLRTALAGKEFYETPRPRWESLHSILGLAELSRLSGRADYQRAFEHIWWSIVKLDRHNNGGFSSGEQATGNPFDPGVIETCSTIAWMATCVEMLHLTGDPHVADELELSLWNSVKGLHSPDGAWSTYNTPMEGRRVPNTTDIAFQKRPGSPALNCCSVNAARGFGLLSAWALLVEPAITAGASPELVVNWYGPSRLEAVLPPGRVAIMEETDYPRGGDIVLRLDLEKPVTFCLKLRIPDWSTATKLVVNGEEVPVTAGTYARLEREWHPGDRITLSLDMRLYAFAGERECADKVSLYRGPLLLVDESAPQLDLLQGKGWLTFGSSRASQEMNAFVEYRFVGDGIKWFGHLYDDAGMARVLVDGKEVAVVDQYGPRRDAPFAWEKSGFGPGPHTLRLVVTGEKSAASRGAWCNLSGFGPAGAPRPQVSDELPSLDLSRLQSTLLPAGELPGALVAVGIVDARGVQLRLRDFGSAGFKGQVYRSWLPATNLPATPFAPTHPLRRVLAEK